MNWLKLQPHATICYDAYVCPYVKRVIDAVGTGAEKPVPSGGGVYASGL